MKTQYTNDTMALVIIDTTKGEHLYVWPHSSIKFEGEIKKQNYTLGFDKDGFKRSNYNQLQIQI